MLGYNEIELCMRGSGYQFIHAADMMYCADNHLRSELQHKQTVSLVKLEAIACIENIFFSFFLQ